jgi:adenylate kinase family enzyme
MNSVDFPIFKTRIDGLDKKFNLNDPEERREYFVLKAGKEIEKLRKYLESGKTFIGYLLGKKNSGKGTYSKLFMEAVGPSTSSGQAAIGHIAVGDIVRDVHIGLSDPEKKKELTEFLKKNYRGFHNLEEIDGLIEGRSQSSLISSELILALLKYEISRRPRQAIFIDGFPRGLDQIGYSLFLRELLGYRDDPDFFVFIDVPTAVIDERIKTRVICPLCKTPRSIKLAPTKEIGYDEGQKSFYLICDNPLCRGARMVPKEGDELGIEPIRERLEADDQVFRKLLELHGVPKVYLRNSIPAEKVKKYADDYEITPVYGYQADEFGKVRVIEKPWIIKDDDGVDSCSLLPAPVALSMIKQVAELLE